MILYHCHLRITVLVLARRVFSLASCHTVAPPWCRLLGRLLTWCDLFVSHFTEIRFFSGVGCGRCCRLSIYPLIIIIQKALFVISYQTKREGENISSFHYSCAAQIHFYWGWYCVLLLCIIMMEIQISSIVSILITSELCQGFTQAFIIEYHFCNNSSKKVG